MILGTIDSIGQRMSLGEHTKRKADEINLDQAEALGIAHMGLSSLAAAANLHHATNARKKTVTSSTVTEVDNDKNFVESIKEKHPQSPNLTKGALKTRKWRDKKRREAAEVEARLQSKQDIIDCLRRENKDLKQRLKLLGADPSIGLDGDDSNGEDCTKETFEEKKATILKKEVREAIALAKSVMTQKIAGLTNDLAENVKDCGQIKQVLTTIVTPGDLKNRETSKSFRADELAVSSTRSVEADSLKCAKLPTGLNEPQTHFQEQDSRPFANHDPRSKSCFNLAALNFPKDDPTRDSIMQSDLLSNRNEGIASVSLNDPLLGPWGNSTGEDVDAGTMRVFGIQDSNTTLRLPNGLSSTAVAQQSALAAMENVALMQLASAHQQREREHQRAIMTLAILEYFEHEQRKFQLDDIHAFATDIYHGQLNVQQHVNSFINNFFSRAGNRGAPHVTDQDEILIRYLSTLADS